MNVMSGKGREEMRKFGTDVNDCLRKTVRRRRVILLEM